jgi:pimeloyl-ACP methyl ester carboxylesterase
MGCPRLRAIAATAELVGSLIHYDRRGTGLSDPVPLDQLPDLQTQVGDAVAVLKAARSDSAAVIGLNDGTIAAVLLAAAHPELCRSLVLFTLTSAHTLAAGLPMESIEEVLEMLQANAVTDESGCSSSRPAGWATSASTSSSRGSNASRSGPEPGRTTTVRR